LPAASGFKSSEGESMKTEKPGLLFVLAAVAVLFTGAGARADLYWESEIVTTGVSSQADGTKTAKNYFTANASRTDLSNGKATITDYNTLDMVHLDLAAKTFMQMSLNAMPAPHAGTAGHNMQIEVEPTTETKKIGDYNCTRYNVTMMTRKSEFWVSKDVKGYEELKSIHPNMLAAMEKNPALAQMDFSGIMSKLNGFPVQVVSRVGNGTVVTTLKSIQQKKIDPGIFKAPSDFTMEKM
jgi:hypothetical protein